MSNEIICCQTIDNGGPSPFNVAALGWHDGLTEGMAECRRCHRTYHVEMVAWDDEHEFRIYGLREVSRKSYDDLMSVYNLTVPPVNQSKQRSDEIAVCTRDALASGLGRLLYVAAIDLTKEIRGAHRMSFSSWA